MFPLFSLNQPALKLQHFNLYLQAKIATERRSSVNTISSALDNNGEHAKQHQISTGTHSCQVAELSLRSLNTPIDRTDGTTATQVPQAGGGMDFIHRGLFDFVHLRGNTSYNCLLFQFTYTRMRQVRLPREALCSHKKK